MEKSNTVKNPQKSKQWDKLKKIIFSKDRLTFLNKIPKEESKLFDTLLDLKTNRITYNSIHPNITKKYNLPPFDKPFEFEKELQSMNKDDLYKFYSESIDNTGNLRIWPSEEVMVIFCLINRDMFKDKVVLELGAGFSGLSGIILARQECKGVVLTDGNSIAVDGLKKNIELNGVGHKCSAEVLVWDRNNKDDRKYDIILMCDCLFFKNYHWDLAYTIKNMLKQNGICLSICPPRGKTKDMFLEIALEVGLKIRYLDDKLKFIDLVDSQSNLSLIEFTHI